MSEENVNFNLNLDILKNDEIESIKAEENKIQ
jgi:hypothetical protein